MKEINNKYFKVIFKDECKDAENLEALVKVYNFTHDEDVDSALACGTHEKFQNYLISMILNQKKFGKDVAYKNLSDPIYKGVSYLRYRELYGASLERLKNFGVYYWPTFSSASKDRHDAGNDGEDGMKMIFEIYMSEDVNTIRDEEYVYSSIDTNNNPLVYTMYPNYSLFGLNT